MSDLYTSFKLPSINNNLLFNSIDNLHEAFCIIEAVRNEKKEIVDFEYLYINKAGAMDNRSRQEKIIGKKLSEILPALHKSTNFDVYANAIINNQSFSLESAFFEESPEIKGYFNIKGTPSGDQLCLTWQNVTEYKLLAEEYKKLDRDKLEQIIQNLPIGIIIGDTSGKVISANKYGLIIHGYDSIEDITLGAEEYNRIFELRYPDGSEIPIDSWPFSKAIKGEYLKNFEVILRNKQSDFERIVNYTVIPLGDINGKLLQLVYVTEDITERILQERRIRKNKELLQAIIDSVPAMITIYDPQVNNIQLNKAIERITGWTIKDHEETSIMELAYPDPHYRQFVFEYMKSVEPGFRDLKMVTKNGEFIDTSWANVMLPDGRMVGIGIDISYRKVMEQKLVKAMLELERSNKDLEQFAYAASHDLQSPLNQIRNFAQLFERKFKNKLDGEAEEYLHFIESAVLRMSRLIQGLLEFSRITSDSKVYTVKTNDIVSAALLNLDFFIKQNNATVDFGNLHNVKGDGVLLSQLFQNLIQNAIKFHGIEPPRVKITSERNQDDVIFKISDNGIGIEPEYFKRIFMIFQRLHDENSYNGTGIGLAVCKRIVEHHHGRIWVESEINKGTTFFFTLPAD